MPLKVMLATTALVALLSPAAAVAAVDAVPVTGRTLDARPATLAFDAAGRAVASYTGLRGTADMSRPFTALAVRRPGDTWRHGPRLPQTVIAHDVAVGRGPVAAIVTVRQSPVRHKRSRSSLVLSRWNTRTATLGRSIRLARGPSLRVGYEGPSPTIFSPHAALTADGDVVVEWLATAPEAQRGVWIATLRADGRLRKPRRLVRGNALYPILRVAPDGSGLLVYARQLHIVARRRAPGGTWGPSERVGSAPSWINGLEDWQVTGSGRRFLVSGIVTDRGGGGVQTQVFSYARSAGPRWSASVLGEYTFLTTGATAYVTDQLRAVPLLGAAGRSLVAWPSFVDGRMRAALGTQLLSDGSSDAAIDDAAIRPDGTAAVTWFDLSNGGTGTPNLALVDPTGAATVTPQLASERGVLGSRVAFDPVTGRPTVVWAQGTADRGYRLVSWTG